MLLFYYYWLLLILLLYLSILFIATFQNDYHYLFRFSVLAIVPNKSILRSQNLISKSLLNPKYKSQNKAEYKCETLIVPRRSKSKQLEVPCLARRKKFSISHFKGSLQKFNEK